MVSLLERFIPRVPESPQAPLELARMMLGYRNAEHDMMDKIHQYWLGEQARPFRIPAGARADEIALAEMSRINILDIVVSSVAQTLYVDGYRAPREDADAPAWACWQANQLDMEQMGVHEAALAYGTSYVTVMPGEPLPVITGYSPLDMTVVYGSDRQWPLWALSVEPNGNKWDYRLFDAESIHYFTSGAIGDDLEYQRSDDHDVGVTPVVRFRNRVSLDRDARGEVEPLIPLQNQVDHTTYGLKVVEEGGAFPQKAILGYLPASEAETLIASAKRIWAFEDPEVKLHEFSAASLEGYLNARESTIRYASVIAQVPPHYLLGQMSNLSAEALVAAEAGLMRKSRQRQMSFGESWEQVLQLAAILAGFETSDDAQVRWADPESRSFGSTVDGLLKLKTIGIPTELLLERVPGFTQQDVERAKTLMEEGDPLGNLTAMLQRQAAPTEAPAF